MCQAVADMRKEERQATARINRLNSILIAANRFEDLKRAAEDSSYQKKLIVELLGNEG